MSDIWIGIDGGGSNTRVAVADSEGGILVYRERTAAASRDKDIRAQDNVRGAIREALAAAGKIGRAHV